MYERIERFEKMGFGIRKKKISMVGEGSIS